MSKPESVFIATPSADARLGGGTAHGLYTHASQKLRTCVVHQTSSLLTFNCNVLWTQAINDRAAQNLKWFAMLHSDIAPEPWWVDKLVVLAEKHQADFVSAIVPIKNNSGLTSTAIGKYADDWGFVKRLAIREVLRPDAPDTFTINDIHADGVHLLCNTGCCLVRMQDRFETGQVYFESPNRIVRVEGEWKAEAIPEDWFFSRAIARAGGKVMATREVRLTHHGIHEFPNDEVWGVERED